MRTMLRTLRECLLADQDIVLVSIVAASGATPRGMGAHMLVGKEGRICGTIGGGAVEYRSEQMAREVLAQKNSRSHSFSLTRNDVEDLGMICGGDVNVFFHYVPAGDRDAVALAEEAERRFSAGQALWLLSDLGQGGRLSLYSTEDGFYGGNYLEELIPHLTRQPRRVQLAGLDLCVEQINAPGRVYIFGCGHVSQELEPVLTHLGFRCVVLDDRPEFARRDLFPSAEEVQQVDFENIERSVSIGSEDYVCVMTRCHAYDTVVQAQVLKCRPRYVGVIGSRKKAAGVRQVLREQYGLSEEELALVTTPVGLDIGAETPAEIAISIAAQLVQVRARG